MAFTRIKIDHEIMGGVPCIAGTRIPAAMLVRMIAAGMSTEEILDQYPQLEEEDIREALRFAARERRPAGEAPRSDGVKLLVDEALHDVAHRL